MRVQAEVWRGRKVCKVFANMWVPKGQGIRGEAREAAVGDM